MIPNVISQPMMMIENLSISTRCSPDFMAHVIMQCLNVKHVYIGMDNGFCDETVFTILKENSLSRLETISIPKCGEKMTMAGIDILIQTCKSLRLLKDLRYFSGVHENEVKILQLRMREENLDLWLDDQQDIVRDPSDTNFIRGLLESQVGAMKDYFEPSTNCNRKYKLT